MSSKTLVFKPTGSEPRYMGKNGSGVCTGLEIYDRDDKITITPINSKAKIANCFIDIPADYHDLTELVNYLNAMRKNLLRRGK